VNVVETILLSNARMTVTVLVVTLKLTMYFPSLEKLRPWTFVERMYWGPITSVGRLSPRPMVPRTELVNGEMTVIVLED
jgi:hypothetical protein